MIEERLQGAERPPFGTLLRRHRLTAGLSQEQLAERSHISVQAVSALERGVRFAPRPDTLALLVKMLALPDDEREQFEQVARASVKAKVRRLGDKLGRVDAGVWAGPVFGDAFFGRQRERDDFTRALRDERCITIWGTGGAGKTRLVVETLRDRGLDVGAAIVFGALASTIGDDAVAGSVAEAFDISGTRAGDPVAAILAEIDARRTLLVLDNCEQVIDGVSQLVQTLLARSQTLTVVCTSRERLRIAGERVVQIGPLEEDDSIRLFGDRANMDTGNDQISRADRASIATICRRLDGLPLALELAAARVPSLGVAQIERALDERFSVLTRGRRTDAARHQTLRATIAWSYALLSPVERIVFERVALINGRFSLEDAVAISIDGVLERWDVIDAIAGLVEKAILSVVDVDEGFEQPYRLLESTRAFAMGLRADERADSDLAASRRRLGRYLLSRVRPRDRPYAGAGGAFEGDVDTIRGFLYWAIAQGYDLPLGAAVAGFLGNVWDSRGLFSEGLRWSETVLRSLPISDDNNVARIQNLRCAALLYMRTGRHADAMAALNDAYALAKRGDDRDVLLWTNVASAKCAAATQDHRLARERAAEALLLFDGERDPASRAAILIMEAFVAVQAGDLEGGRDAYLRLIAEYDARTSDAASVRLRNQALADLAEIEYGLGNFSQAAEIGRRNVANFADASLSLRLSSLSNLCIYLACDGAFEELETYAARGLQLARETGNTLYVSMIALACATMALERGERMETSAEIFGWVNRAFEAGGLDVLDRMTRDRLEARLISALSPTALASSMQRGALLGEGDVAGLALSLLR